MVMLLQLITECTMHYIRITLLYRLNTVQALSPAQGEAWYTLFMHARNIQLYFRKKLHALPCPYAEDYTNQEYRAFFEIHSSDDLTYRTLPGYFSDMPVSFIQTER